MLLITDEMLYRAAARSSAAFTEHREADYDPAGQHEFSAKFERRIQRLKRKADHPVLYRTMQRVASVLLAIVIGGTAWLAIDVKAREDFFGWVKGIYENYIVYHFSEPDHASTELHEYRPAWIPDGYTEVYHESDEAFGIVAYLNDENDTLSLMYIPASEGQDVFVDHSGAKEHETTVNGSPATVLIFEEPNQSNELIWCDDENILFTVSGFLEEDDLVKVAESVEIKK